MSPGARTPRGLKAKAARAVAWVGSFGALALIGSGAASWVLPGTVAGYDFASAGMLGSRAVPVFAAAAPDAGTAAGPDGGSPAGDAGAVLDAGAVFGACGALDAGVEGGAPPAAPGITAEGRVVLNVATEDELRRLPGIGPARAQAILGLRARLGRFRKPEDLLRVRGIGRRSLARLRPLVVVDPPP